MFSQLTAAVAVAALSLSSFVDAGAIYARHRLQSSEYQNIFDQYTRNGWKLNYVSGYLNNGVQNYAAIFEQVPHNPQIAAHGISSSVYQSRFDDATKNKGYTPVLVNGYTAPDGTDRYAAIWEKISGSTPWVARHGLDSNSYQAEFNKWVGQGYRLKHVSGYSVNGQARYAAIWDKPASIPAWNARHGMTSDSYQNYFNQQVAAGYTLRLVSAYNVGGTDYYAAIFEKQPAHAWVARHRQSSQLYQSNFDSFTSQGYQLKVVCGYNIGNADQYAAIWSK